jgi:hypothetical protein
VDASGHGCPQVEISGHSGQKWTQANTSKQTSKHKQTKVEIIEYNLMQIRHNLIRLDAI